MNRAADTAMRRIPAILTQPKFKAKSLAVNGLVGFLGAFGTMPVDARTEDRSATGASDLPSRHRSRCAEGPLPAPPGRAHRVSRRRQRARSAARPPSERFRHRYVRASLPGQEAV